MMLDTRERFGRGPRDPNLSTERVGSTRSFSARTSPPLGLVAIAADTLRGADYGASAMTKDQLLAALDKPRSLSMLVSMAGSRGAVAVQTQLMQMRDEGIVKFDIKKGLWSRA